MIAKIIDKLPENVGLVKCPNCMSDMNNFTLYGKMDYGMLYFKCNHCKKITQVPSWKSYRDNLIDKINKEKITINKFH